MTTDWNSPAIPLEVGKTYLDRNGNKHGPLKRDLNTLNDDEHIWYADGAFYSSYMTTVRSALDLIKIHEPEPLPKPQTIFVNYYGDGVPCFHISQLAAINSAHIIGGKCYRAKLVYEELLTP